MNRTIQIALVSLAVFVVGCGKRNHSASIPDATKTWTQSFSGPGIDIDGNLAIRIRGQLTGVANVNIDGIDHLLRGSGNVERIYAAPENWNDTCSIKFTPTSVRHGDLTLDISFGGRPSWQDRPSSNAEPLGYTGGWTTWHRGGKQKYSQGFYRHSQKDGDWQYWEENGKLLRGETWHNGKLIQE